MKIIKPVFAVILLMFPVLQLHSIPEKQLQKIIHNSFIPPKISYRGTKTIINWYGDSKTQATEFNIYYTPVSKYRYEFKSPVSGRIIIMDGNYEWQYEPAHKTVIKQESPLKIYDNTDNELANLNKNYYFELSSNASITNFKNTQIIHFKYNDGLNIISLFESRNDFDFSNKQQSVQNSLMENSSYKDLFFSEILGENNIVSKKVKNIRFVIIGSQPKEVLQKILNSIR